jgi:DNA mismatch endonuclease, patch repair protein
VTDRLTKQQRSRLMSRVRSSNTAPEMLLRRTLYALGARGWRCHRKGLPGTPDLAFGPSKVAVFVDGAFWHGHPSRHTPGRSGEYWDAKIARNQARDRQVDYELRRIGWRVLRLWDFDVVSDPVSAAERVIAMTKRDVPAIV